MERPDASVKTVDVSRTIHELTTDHPELVDILKSLGFAGVSNPVLRATVGRTMTLRDGCRKLGLDLHHVAAALVDHGYTVIGVDPPAAPTLR